VRKKYQRKDRKSNHKFEVVGGQELLVRVPLPIAEVWAEMQAQVEQLTGQAGLQILHAILENEVTHRVGPPEFCRRDRNPVPVFSEVQILAYSGCTSRFLV
jgi:hypothetical protein